MTKSFITPLQMAFMFVTCRAVTPIVFLPTVTTNFALQDAWMGASLGAIIGLILTWLTLTLARQFPEQTLVEYAPKLLGKWLGTIVSLAMIFFYFFSFALALRQFSEFVVNSSMPETPIEVFIFSLGLAVLYGVRTGVETIARANAFVIIVILSGIFLVLVLAYQEMDLSNLLPVLDAPWLEILESGAVSGSWYGEVTILLTLYPAVNRQKELPKYLYGGTLIDGLVTLVITISAISVFGPIEAHNQTYPFFSVVKMISVGDIVERIESINLAIWIALVYLKSCIMLYCAAFGLSQLLNFKEPRPLTSPLAFLGVFAGLFLFHNFAEMRAFLDALPWMTFSGTFSLVLPITMLIFAFFKKRLRMKL